MFRIWVEGPTFDHVGNFSEETSPLLFSKRLFLTYTVEGLPDRLDQRLDNPVLVTCMLDVPLPHNIADKFLSKGALYLGDFPVSHYLSQVFLCPYKLKLEPRSDQQTFGCPPKHANRQKAIGKVSVDLSVSRGSVAEWSARRTCNPTVPGSSPALATCWICARSSRVQILGHSCK